MNLRVCLLLFSIGLVLSATPNCLHGSVLTINNTCIVSEYIQGCFRYASASTCSQCEFNYELSSNSRCNYNQKPKHQCCKQFSAQTGQCSACQNGLFLHSGACEQAFLPGCLVKDKQRCLNCAVGYYLDDESRCVKGINGCRQYVSRDQCKKCQQGYVLDRKRCLPRELIGCSEQVGDKCLACFKPFELTEDQVCEVSHCSEVGEFGCLDCDNGFYVKKDGNCQPVELGCNVYRHGQCMNCSKGFNYVNGRCLIDGCKNQTQTGCNVCSQNYELKQKRCKLPNCIQSRNGTCLICADYHRISNGTCIKSTINCVDYVGVICRECANKFYLGTDNHCHPFELGCVEYNKGLCTKCLSAFQLTNSSCVIDGCQTYNGAGCKVCQQGYVRTVRETCQMENCQKSAKGVCQVCNNGYSVDGTGRCSKTDKVCMRVRSNGTCEKCSDGFFVNSTGRCQATKPGCIYQGPTCISCSAPFRMSPNKTCVLLGCKILKSDGCSQCLPPFGLVKKNCEIEGCEKYSAVGCDKCTKPYNLTENKSCKIAFCAKSASGKCLACETGYVQVAGRCFKEDQNCEVYENNGTCKKCLVNYNLNFVVGLCTRIMDPVTVLEKPKNFMNLTKLRVTRILRKIKDTHTALPGQSAPPEGYQYVTIMEPSKTNASILITYRRLRPISYSKTAVGNQTQAPKGYEYESIQQQSINKTTQIILIRRLRRIITSDIPFALANQTAVPDGFYYSTTVEIGNFSQDDDDEGYGSRDKLYTNIISTNVKIMKFGLGSSIGRLIYSSVWEDSQEMYSASLKSKGWKAKFDKPNEWVGLQFLSSVPVARVQILSGQDNAYPSLSYIQYSTESGGDFIRYPTPFTIKQEPKSTKHPAFIKFPNFINVTAIRIVIAEYVVWPALRFEILYKDSETYTEDENNVETYDDEINNEYGYDGQLILCKSTNKTGQLVNSLDVLMDDRCGMMRLARKFNSSKRLNQPGYLYMSQISTFDYSSIESEENQVYGIDQVGWRAGINQTGQWVSLTAYKAVQASIIQIRPTDDGSCVSQFEIEYSQDLKNYTTLNETFKVVDFNEIGIAKIKFGPIKAEEIRIKILKYIKNPAFRFEILYMDEFYNLIKRRTKTTRVISLNRVNNTVNSNSSREGVSNESSMSTVLNVSNTLNISNASSSSSTSSESNSSTVINSSSSTATNIPPPPPPIQSKNTTDLMNSNNTNSSINLNTQTNQANSNNSVNSSNFSNTANSSANSTNSASSSANSTNLSSNSSVNSSANSTGNSTNNSMNSTSTTTTTKKTTFSYTVNRKTAIITGNITGDQKQLSIDNLATFNSQQTQTGFQDYTLQSATGWRSRRNIVNGSSSSNWVNLTLSFATNMSVNYIKISPRSAQESINQFIILIRQQSDTDFKPLPSDRTSSSNLTVYSTVNGSAIVILKASSLISFRICIISANGWPGLKLSTFVLYRGIITSTYDISNLRSFDGMEYSKVSANYPVIFVRYSTTRENNDREKKGSLVCYKQCKPLIIANNGTVEFKPSFISNFMEVSTYIVNNRLPQNKYTPILSII